MEDLCPPGESPTYSRQTVTSSVSEDNSRYSFSDNDTLSDGSDSGSQTTGFWDDSNDDILLPPGVDEKPGGGINDEKPPPPPPGPPPPPPKEIPFYIPDEEMCRTLAQAKVKPEFIDIMISKKMPKEAFVALSESPSPNLLFRELIKKGLMPMPDPEVLADLPALELFNDVEVSVFPDGLTSVIRHLIPYCDDDINVLSRIPENALHLSELAAKIFGRVAPTKKIDKIGRIPSPEYKPIIPDRIPTPPLPKEPEKPKVKTKAQLLLEKVMAKKKAEAEMGNQCAVTGSKFSFNVFGVASKKTTGVKRSFEGIGKDSETSLDADEVSTPMQIDAHMDSQVQCVSISASTTKLSSEPPETSPKRSRPTPTDIGTQISEETNFSKGFEEGSLSNRRRSKSPARKFLSRNRSRSRSPYRKERQSQNRRREKSDRVSPASSRNRGATSGRYEDRKDSRKRERSRSRERSGRNDRRNISEDKEKRREYRRNDNDIDMDRLRNKRDEILKKLKNNSHHDGSVKLSASNSGTSSKSKSPSKSKDRIDPAKEVSAPPAPPMDIPLPVGPDNPGSSSREDGISFAVKPSSQAANVKSTRTDLLRKLSFGFEEEDDVDAEAKKKEAAAQKEAEAERLRLKQEEAFRLEEELRLEEERKLEEEMKAMEEQLRQKRLAKERLALQRQGKLLDEGSVLSSLPSSNTLQVGPIDDSIVKTEIVKRHEDTAMEKIVEVKQETAPESASSSKKHKKKKSSKKTKKEKKKKSKKSKKRKKKESSSSSSSSESDEEEEENKDDRKQDNVNDDASAFAACEDVALPHAQPVKVEVPPNEMMAPPPIPPQNFNDDEVVLILDRSLKKHIRWPCRAIRSTITQPSLSFSANLQMIHPFIQLVPECKVFKFPDEIPTPRHYPKNFEANFENTEIRGIFQVKKEPFEDVAKIESPVKKDETIDMPESVDLKFERDDKDYCHGVALTQLFSPFAAEQVDRERPMEDMAPVEDVHPEQENNEMRMIDEVEKMRQEEQERNLMKMLNAASKKNNSNLIQIQTTNNQEELMQPGYQGNLLAVPIVCAAESTSANSPPQRVHASISQSNDSPESTTGPLASKSILSTSSNSATGSGERDRNPKKSVVFFDGIAPEKDPDPRSPSPPSAILKEKKNKKKLSLLVPAAVVSASQGRCESPPPPPPPGKPDRLFTIDPINKQVFEVVSIGNGHAFSPNGLENIFGPQCNKYIYAQIEHTNEQLLIESFAHSLVHFPHLTQRVQM